jgi:hypothetical protein
MSRSVFPPSGLERSVAGFSRGGADPIGIALLSDFFERPRLDGVSSLFVGRAVVHS